MQTRSQTRKISKKDQPLFYNNPIIDRAIKVGILYLPWISLARTDSSVAYKAHTCSLVRYSSDVEYSRLFFYSKKR